LLVREAKRRLALVRKLTWNEKDLVVLISAENWETICSVVTVKINRNLLSVERRIAPAGVFCRRECTACADQLKVKCKRCGRTQTDGVVFAQIIVSLLGTPYFHFCRTEDFGILQE
jgi:hypothetical protein